MKFSPIALSPLALLFWGLVSVLFFEITPIASGYGWDGVLYGQLALDFEAMIGNITPYRAGRIFPSILIHYLFKLLSIPLTLPSVLLGYRLYNILVLALSGLVWVKISRHLKLNTMAFGVGFLALFINPSLFHFNFYFPVSTDSTAFLLSLGFLFFYLKNKKYALLALIALSAFTFPISALIGAILFIAPNGRMSNEKRRKRPAHWLAVALLVLPLLLGYTFNSCEGPIKQFIADHLHFVQLKNPSDIAPFSFYTLCIDLLASIYVVGLVSYLLRGVDIVESIKANLTMKILVRSSVVLALLVGFGLVTQAISDPELHAFGLKRFVLRITSMDTYKYPLHFVVSHFSYYGFIIGFLILFFKPWVRYVQQHDFPVFLVLLLFFVLSIATESRALINFFPFVVIYLVRVIDFQAVRRRPLFFGILALLSVLSSKIWFPLDLPPSTFPNTVDTGLDQFPLQGFFMNMGPWINPTLFLIHAVIASIVFVLLWRMVRRIR